MRRACQVLVDPFNDLRRIVLNTRKVPVAPGVAVENRQNDAIVFLKFLRLVPVIPPRQTPAVQEEDRVRVFISEFLKVHSLLIS